MGNILTMNDYASRKFIVAMTGLALSTVLVWFTKINGTEYVALNSILGGAYMAANVLAIRKQDDNR